MTTLHIANTHFEWELTQTTPSSLFPLLHSIFLQLQFLPFLYASQDESVLVSHIPEDGYFEKLREAGFMPPTLHLLSNPLPFPSASIEPWGASRAISEWKMINFLTYEGPDRDCVKEVNSKEFSFIYSPKLPAAALLSSEEEMRLWLKKTTGPRVLKTAFGVSGKGHFFIDASTDLDKILKFLRKEWENNHSVIAEPWVEREFDFSTQWKITKEGSILYLGATLCENDARGSYKKTTVGDVAVVFGQRLSYLQDHLEIAWPLLQTIKEKGYFGHVGLDAMVYKDLQHPHIGKLHPIVEINARKTMGWVALAVQQKYFQDKILTLSFTSHSTEKNFLPDFVVDANGKKTGFSKRLILEAHPLAKKR